MRKIGQAALVAALVASLVAPAFAQDTAALEAAQTRWEEAFATGDGAKAADMVFTEDARLLPDGAPLVEGREAVAAFWQGAFDAGYRDLELGVISVEMLGDDTMIETGTFAVTVPTEDGGTTRASGKALVIWKLEADGVWRMSQDMWNADQ